MIFVTWMVSSSPRKAAQLASSMIDYDDYVEHPRRGCRRLRPSSAADHFSGIAVEASCRERSRFEQEIVEEDQKVADASFPVSQARREGP
jgi:hypothetical protein